jgi:hypothetical protein
VLKKKKNSKMSDLGDSENEVDVVHNVEEAWNVGRSALIPEKSRERYESLVSSRVQLHC